MSVPASSPELDRALGPTDATCVVIGAIIGVGIFFTPSRVAELAGSESLALAAWALGGAIAFLGALTFAELGGVYPRAGAQYSVLRDAFGPLPSFVFVFCNATAIQAGAIGIIAIVCAQNFGIALGNGPLHGIPLLIVSFVLIAGLALANLTGVRAGSRIQNLTVGAKLLTLVAVVVIAGIVEPTHAAPTAPTEESGWWLAAVFAALVPAFFSYGGWQHALWISGEIRDPTRNVPRAIVVGVVIVVAIYLLANLAYFDLLGFDALVASDAPAADAVSTAWAGGAHRLIAGAVAISAFGVLNAQFLAGPRLVYGMAKDGRFFSVFARVTRWRTPGAAICLLAVLATFLLLAAGPGGIDALLTGVVFIDGIFFALTGVAMIVLRVRRPNVERPVRVPFFPLVPILFILGECAIVVGAYVDPTVRRAALIGIAWIGGAIICFALFFRNATDANDA